MLTPFIGGLSENLYRHIVTAACEAATLAAMRAVQHEAQIPSSSRSHVPVDPPSSDGNESGTNNLDPFERMYPSVSMVLVWSGQVILPCRSSCQEESTSC